MSPKVSALSVTPVKGTRRRTVESIDLGPTGARGDRRFYVIDDRGRMVNGKVVVTLQTVLADWNEDTRELVLTLPDGRHVRVGDAALYFRGHVGRCAITTRDPETAERDLPTLDLLRSYRGELDTTSHFRSGSTARCCAAVASPSAIRCSHWLDIRPRDLKGSPPAQCREGA